MSNIEITLEGGGIIDTFHNNWDQCEARNLLHIENLEGWYGGVDASVTPDLGRFRRHGAFPGRTIRSHRKIDLTLTWIKSISKGVEGAYMGAARLASSIAWDEGTYTMSVNENGRILTTEVQLDGEPQFQPVHPGSEDAFRIRIPLRANDPFLYSPPQTTIISVRSRTPVVLNDWFTQGLHNSAGQQVLAWSEPARRPAALVNEGTADAYPIITVTANCSAGVELAINGGVVQYVGPLFDQSPLVIDYRRGSATINDRDASFNLRKREWKAVPPHSTVVPHMNLLGPGTGWATGELSSTWI